MTVLKMTDLDLQGKRVLIREDLNVPVKDGVVASDARILAALPTIKLALEKGAAVMVCSHLGRPTEGEFSAENSLKPVADYLSKALGRDVPLVADYRTVSRSRPAIWCCSRTCASTRARRRTPTSWRKSTPPCATYSSWMPSVPPTAPRVRPTGLPSSPRLRLQACCWRPNSMPWARP